MSNNGPIIIIEDDTDDQELLNDIFKELHVTNLVKFFTSCLQAFDYLLTTIDNPFLILSDINLPAMTGLELCKKIVENELLRVKAVPFIFLTTSSDRHTITTAYEMPIQGFFVKPSSIHELKEMLKMIIEYWKISRRPYPV
jgi:CheY-like chemotaxis protein